MRKSKLIKSLVYLYHLGWKSIKLRSKEDLWELHRGFYETKPKAKPRNGVFAISVLHRLTLRLLDGIENGVVVLDAGCNNGNIGRHLVNRGCVVYGIDVSPELVKEAQKKGLFASVCPVEKLTFTNGYFDVCLAFEILEHLFNPEDGVRELDRVLKVGGKLIGSVPYPFGKFSRSSKHQWIWHQHDFNKESLRQLFEKFFSPKKIIINQRLVFKDDNAYKLFFEITK